MHCTWEVSQISPHGLQDTPWSSHCLLLSHYDSPTDLTHSLLYLWGLFLFPSPGAFPFFCQFSYIAKYTPMHPYHNSSSISMRLEFKVAYQPCCTDIPATLVLLLSLETPSLFLPQAIRTFLFLTLLIFVHPYPHPLGLNSNVTCTTGLSWAPY